MSESCTICNACTILRAGAYIKSLVTSTSKSVPFPVSTSPPLSPTPCAEKPPGVCHCSVFTLALILGAGLAAYFLVRHQSEVQLKLTLVGLRKYFF